MKKESFKNEYELIAIGISSWFVIASIAYTIKFLIEDFFIINSVNYETSIWICELTYSFLLVAIFYVFLKCFKKVKNYSKTLLYLIGSYVIIFFIQYFSYLYLEEYMLEFYSSEWSIYHDKRVDYSISYFVTTISDFSKYFALGVIFYLFIKKQSK